MSEITDKPLRYRGHRSTYLDIAARGTENKEFLGLSVEYAIHPSGIGCFILRFVVHGEGADPKNYKHLTYREKAQFLVQNDAVQSEVFKGYRLNKIAVPVFQPPVKRDEVDFFALKFGVWNQLEEFVIATVQAEGFDVTADLEKELRVMVVGVPTPEDAIQSVVKFPDLNDPKQKASALSQVQKPVDDDDEDSENDGDDEDGDDEKKDWLN